MGVPHVRQLAASAARTAAAVALGASRRAAGQAAAYGADRVARRGRWAGRGGGAGGARLLPAGLGLGLHRAAARTVGRAYSDPYGEEPYDEQPYGEDSVEEEPVEEEPEPVASGPAAEKDVTITKCVRDSLIGWQHADLTIVNGSRSPAGYVVFVEFLDAKGTVLTDGIATTDDLAPGASVKVEAQGVGEVPKGTTCRVKQVTRDPM
ncbi:FxLYD domain-containing protein [Streptomyces sp. MT29]|nr:FxLYD domain-containing protein [Streptomyces sp. MT29]